MTHVVAVEDRHRLTAPTGLAALGPDALASCAYGPESIVLALAVAGSVGIGFTLPVTLVIVGLLAVLVVCYRQVIAAYPDGGGAYTVARDNLGPRTGLVAAGGDAGERAILLVGEVAPDRWWQQVLFNKRGSVVARYAGRHSTAVVCRFRFRLLPRRPAVAGPGRRVRGLVLPRG